jgi:hypothetical protein
VVGSYGWGSLPFTPPTLSALAQEHAASSLFHPSFIPLSSLFHPSFIPLSSLFHPSFIPLSSLFHPFIPLSISGRCGVSPQEGVRPQTASFIGGLGTRGNRSSVPPPATTLMTQSIQHLFTDHCTTKYSYPLPAPQCYTHQKNCFPHCAHDHDDLYLPWTMPTRFAPSGPLLHPL